MADWPEALPFIERQGFQRSIIESPPPELIRLGVILEDVLIGYVDLHGDEPHRRELGFVIGERSRWGRGLGRLAAAACLDYGFDSLALREIWAEAVDGNQRSVRILQSLGLHETGRGSEALYLDRASHYRQFVITAQDWALRRRRLATGPTSERPTP